MPGRGQCDRITDMSTDLTISHTYADGTTLDGDCRPHHGIVKAAGWRWAPSLGQWIVRASRDTILSPYRVRALNDLADQLRAVGFTVDVEVDNTPRPVAAVEADRAERSDAREAHLEARAGRLKAEATALIDAADALADVIPFGQPLLTDHYSYKRDLAFRARIQRKHTKGFETLAAARATAHRAAAVGHRSDESIGTVMRRIDTLTTELRDLERKVDADWFADQSEEWRDYILFKLTEVTGKLDYWEQVLVDREAAGEKVFRQDRLKPKDRVRASWGWGTVIKPNKKTVKVRWDVDGFAHNTDYSKLLDHRPAGQEATPNAG